MITFWTYLKVRRLEQQAKVQGVTIKEMEKKVWSIQKIAKVKTDEVSLLLIYRGLLGNVVIGAENTPKHIRILNDKI